VGDELQQRDDARVWASDGKLLTPDGSDQRLTALVAMGRLFAPAFINTTGPST
jgi:hypothetical protein